MVSLDFSLGIKCIGGYDVSGIARRSGAIEYVGVPHGSGHNFNLNRLFMNNITLRGGAAPARAYIR